MLTHAYCDACEDIRQITAEPLERPDATGRYLGGDVACDFCGAVICTLFEAAEGEREGEAGRGPSDPV